MIFVLDCGNSNICFGVYEKEKLKFSARIRTSSVKTEDEYASIISNIFSLNSISTSSISGAAISSVVPVLTRILTLSVKKLFNVNPVIVGPGVKTGIKLLIDDPASCGADLVCTAVGTGEKYPVPAIVIDMGTATKITVVDKDKNFCGGSIAPGVEISLNALSASAALLPDVGLRKSIKVIGTNTVDCMVSGSILGNACMIDGMIERYKEQLGEVKTIVACGGIAKAVTPHCKNNIVLDNNLLLDGLLTIYNRNQIK